jgi:LDH2 family malate/lactate/ureidoglycolate dehydrogenase
VDGTGRPTTDPEAALTGALTIGHLALRSDVVVALRRRAGPATTASRQERTS